MKRFLILLSILFCTTVCADTINLHWLNEDGTVYENSTCVIDADLILPSTPPTKYGYTFTGWKFSSYTPIEYLQSTGTQYIDTGYIFNNVLNARIILDGSFNGTASQWNGIGLGGSTFGGPHIGLGKSDHEFAYTAGVGDQRTGVVGNFNQRYLFDLNIPESIYMVYDTNNNVLVNVYPIIKQNRVGQYSALIFGYYGNPSTDGGPYKIRAMTIYSVKFYNAGSIVRDFIPVLDTNGVPSMYHKVTEQFFYNQGTGQFIAGPVLQ